MRSQWWYLYVFWHTMVFGIINAWLMYRCDSKLLGAQKPLKQRIIHADTWPLALLFGRHKVAAHC